MKTYNLFISHSWRYADQYDRLINLLRNGDISRSMTIRSPKMIRFTMRTTIPNCVWRSAII